MFSRLRALFRRNETPPVVVVTGTGFELRGPAVSTVVQWTNVRRAVAYKRDLYTADCIVLAFECDGEALGDARADVSEAVRIVEVAETWPGYPELFGAMEVWLGVSPAWYLEIMTPVFEATPMLLYARHGTGAGETGPTR